MATIKTKGFSFLSLFFLLNINSLEADELRICSEVYFLAGNIDYIDVGLTPGISYVLHTLNDGGWIFSIDYFKPFKSGSVSFKTQENNINSYKNTNLTTIWFSRWANIKIRKYPIFLASGLGWGYFSTILNENHFRAGTLGYRIEALISPLHNKRLKIGGYFSGHPWLTSGFNDERIGFKLEWNIWNNNPNE